MKFVIFGSNGGSKMGATGVTTASIESKSLAKRDSEALLLMIRNGYFQNHVDATGWELEGNLITKFGRPDLGGYKKIANLRPTKNFSFQGEVGSHNFEINGSAINLNSKNPFMQMQSDQTDGIYYMHQRGLNPMVSGVFLPLTLDDLGESEKGFNELKFRKALNPSRPRYLTIFDEWRKQNGSSLVMNFEGHSSRKFHSFLLEMAMTSVHIHKSVSAEQVHTGLNIAAMISAACNAPFGSSPRFLGKTGTWKDYRYLIWRKTFPGRTGVGPGWCNSLEEYLNFVTSFPQWLDSDEQECPLEALNKGNFPKLHHLPIAQGCLWWDARPKFFDGAITIEERTKGSGSPMDNTSKAVLWTGLMSYYLNHEPDAWRNFGNYDLTEQNSASVAKNGLDAKVFWFGESISVKELLLEILIPQARIGHQDLDQTEIDEYLGNVTSIIKSGRTPANWIIEQAKIFNRMRLTPAEIDLNLTLEMAKRTNQPIVDWRFAD